MQPPLLLGQKRSHDTVEDLEAVNLGVMGRAKGDEELLARYSRFAVVDMKAPPGFRLPADPAEVAVALEGSQAPSAEEE